MDGGGELYRRLLPERFAPCPHTPWQGPPCGSTGGWVVVLAHHRNIGIYCDHGHRRAQFEWVSHEEFLPGGKFAHADVPVELLSASTANRRSTKFRPAESAKKNASEARHCAICQTPALASLDPERVIRWLARNDRSLHGRLRNALGVAADIPDSMTIWPGLIDRDLYNEIVDRVRNSAIQADHLFQTALLQRAEAKMNKKAFAYAAKRMIAPLCGICNRGRGLRLEPFDVLEDRFLAWFFQGNRDAMESSEAYGWFREAYALCSEEAARLARGVAG